MTLPFNTNSHLEIQINWLRPMKNYEEPVEIFLFRILLLATMFTGNQFPHFKLKEDCRTKLAQLVQKIGKLLRSCILS